MYNLDIWMMGIEHCRELLFEAAQSSDLILVEGVMGLYDGEPSSADVALQFGLPILPVINAASTAQTFAAILHGLSTYRDGLQIAGVVANRIASPRHEELVCSGLPASLPVTVVKRSDAVNLPERHLGLHIADDIDDLDSRIDALADLLTATALTNLPPVIEFFAPQQTSTVAQLLDGISIAVACDQAFCFLYLANLEWLQRMGAHLHIFSPLDDSELPDVDAIYLPGGYPELHAQKLSANSAIADQIRAHVNAGKPLLAECGGMLYLADALIDLDGKKFAMLGLLPGEVTMGKRLASIGPQQLIADGESIRGHTFHYSSFNTEIAPIARATTANGRDGEAVYQIDSIVASYVHWYFPSNPTRVARWLLGED
ncbi:MAG: cobB [Verrucomicrobiaceae bacterium]|nr:cobB [Verrucomicrobiaceae bacterium]